MLPLCLRKGEDVKQYSEDVKMIKANLSHIRDLKRGCIMKDEKNMRNLALEAIDFESSEVYESNKEKCFAIPHNCYDEIKIVSSNKKPICGKP